MVVDWLVWARKIFTRTLVYIGRTYTHLLRSRCSRYVSDLSSLVSQIRIYFCGDQRQSLHRIEDEARARGLGPAIIYFRVSRTTAKFSKFLNLIAT